MKIAKNAVLLFLFIVLFFGAFSTFVNIHANVLIEAYANGTNRIDGLKPEPETTSVTFEGRSHPFGVKAFDKAGNVGNESEATTVDSTMPFASIDAPANNSHLREAIEIYVTGEDANFNRTELYINGRLAAKWNVNGTRIYSWDTTTLTDGVYVIALKVYDNENNLGTDEISVIVDHTPPIAEIRTPSPLDYVKGVCNITIFAYDVNLKWIELYINRSILALETTNGIHSFNWNASLINGARAIVLNVYDRAGTKTERTITVTVDNTLPSVGITTPQPGETLSGTIMISFTASDTNLESVQLFIDQSAFSVTGETFYQWDTTKVGDGTHVVKLIAYDKSGNTAETSVSVDTINSKLNLEANKNLYLVIGTPLGFMLGILIAYIILKRKEEIG